MKIRDATSSFLIFLYDSRSDWRAYNFRDSVCLVSSKMWLINATSHSSDKTPLDSDLLNKAYGLSDNNNDHSNDNMCRVNLSDHKSYQQTSLSFSHLWRRKIDQWGISLLAGTLKFLILVNTVGGATPKMDLLLVVWQWISLFYNMNTLSGSVNHSGVTARKFNHLQCGTGILSNLSIRKRHYWFVCLFSTLLSANWNK